MQERPGVIRIVEMRPRYIQAIEEDARNLKKLAAKINTDHMREPSFLIVLTGTGGFRYPREDGVGVVPLRSVGI